MLLKLKKKKPNCEKGGNLKVYYQIRDGCVLILGTQTPSCISPWKVWRNHPRRGRIPGHLEQSACSSLYKVFIAVVQQQTPSEIALGNFNTVYENTDFLHNYSHDLWTVTS